MCCGGRYGSPLTAKCEEAVTERADPAMIPAAMPSRDPAGTPGRPEPPERAPRYPAIARACFHLNWLLLCAWGVYLCGPDAGGFLWTNRQGLFYALFAGSFFVLHFVVIATGIIALFVVIIEVYSRRPVVGLRAVLLSLGLPIVSFLYFSARYLSEVRRFVNR